MNRWTEKVDLPTAWVHAFGPRLCARHGEPAEDLRPVTFHTRIPLWFPIGALVSVAVIVYVARSHVASPVVLAPWLVARSKWPPMKVQRWPYCLRCLALHRLHLMCMAVMVVGLAGYLLGTAGLLFGAVGPASGMETDTLLALLVGGLVLALIGALVGRPFSWRKLGGAHVLRDQSALRVTAHGRFAADVRARLATQPAPVAP